MARAQAWAPDFFAPERQRARWKINTLRVSARSGAQFFWARRAPQMSAALHGFHFEFHIGGKTQISHDKISTTGSLWIFLIIIMLGTIKNLLIVKQ
jgi:hypothetical protein